MNQSTFNALFKHSELHYDLFRNTNLVELNDSIKLETNIEWIHQKHFVIHKKFTISRLSIRNTNFPVYAMKNIIKDYFKFFNNLSVVIVRGKMKLITNVVNDHIILTIRYKNKLIAYSKDARII